MITFDVTWDVMSYVIGIDTGALYYCEDEVSIKLYYVQNNNVILYYAYDKYDSEQDLMWKDTYLKRAVRVLRLQDKNKIILTLKTEDGNS